MATYAQLVTEINNQIITNGRGDITGAVLRQVLLDMLGYLAAGANDQILYSESGGVEWRYPFIPVDTHNADHTIVAGEASKCIYRAPSDTTPRTWTIPSNASVAFPVGTTLSFINDGTGAVTLAINSDTLVWAGPGTTGSRTLAQYGQATATKVSATRWYLIGTGLS